MLMKQGEVVAAGPLAEALTAENLTTAFDLDLALSHNGGRFAARAL